MNMEYRMKHFYITRSIRTSDSGPFPSTHHFNRECHFVAPAGYGRAAFPICGTAAAGISKSKARRRSNEAE